jgi:DNA polymerase
MGADQHQDWRNLAASALEWWHDAGVDTLVADEPRDWTTQAKPVVAAARGVVAPIVDAPRRLPDTLSAFVAWRIGREAPEAGWSGEALPPEGDPASPLMVVLDCPEGAALLDGAPGRLFDRMLAAIGYDRSTIYLTALAAIRPIAGRLPPEAEAELSSVLRHHIALAAPKRLLVLGSAASRALIGMDSARARRSLRTVNLDSGTVEAVASWHPRFLLENPARKADAWKDLQLLIGGLR